MNSDTKKFTDKTDWMSLKSGTDVRGVALEGVAGEPVNLTDEAVSAIVKAFASALPAI